MTAGYSKKTLLEKLGATADGKTLIVSFATHRAQLTRQFRHLARSTYPDGALWIAWPKGTSRISTDLTEDVVREVGLAHRLVDVKVASLDEVWSGLKFVFRLKDRNGPVSHRLPRTGKGTKQ